MSTSFLGAACSAGKVHQHGRARIPFHTFRLEECGGDFLGQGFFERRSIVSGSPFVEMFDVALCVVGHFGWLVSLRSFKYGGAEITFIYLNTVWLKAEGDYHAKIEMNVLEKQAEFPEMLSTTGHIYSGSFREPSLTV